MSNETIIVILLLIAVTGVCAAVLHWLIGIVQRGVVRQLVPIEVQQPRQPSFRRLLVNWGGYGLRTVIWVAFAFFVILLLPQMRARLENLIERLWQLRDHASEWLLDTGAVVTLDIVATVFLARFAAALIRTGFELFETRATERGETSAKRRAQTLSSIFRAVAQSLIFFIGLMTVLQHLHVNVTPILASASVVGIAVGFGAQSLIKDFFAGFMILLEDQYNVGDSVKIGETNGLVERLTLRMTLIRAMDGSLTTVPNGTITTVANFSKDWSRAVLDLEIDYTEDADRAMQTMLDTARQMRAERPTEMLEEPVMLGIERLTHTGIALRMTVKTAPNKQAEIARELRRRIKLAFDQAGIKAPAREQLVLVEGKAEDKGNLR